MRVNISNLAPARQVSKFEHLHGKTAERRRSMFVTKDVLIRNVESCIPIPRSSIPRSFQRSSLRFKDRPVERGKGGKVFPCPATFGASPSLKNTENGVPDGFFLT